MVVLGLGVAAAGPGCTPHTVEARRDPSVDKQLVEIFSWWRAPGEAEALEALIDTHHAAHPDARIFNAFIESGGNAREQLDQRFLKNEPPDIFQEYVHDLRAVASLAVGRRMPLDDLVEQLGLRQVMFPEILQEAMRDGHLYVMPVNVHRENALFYNRRVLAAHHLVPPTTLPELLAACRTLKAAGVVPLATSHQGWILRIMFNSLAMASMGINHYHDYFSGHGDAADVARLRDAVDVFADILETYTNADAADEGFGWTNAAQAVYNGEAAMYLHGDWVKGYFVQLGWSGDADFGVVGAPGASELFLYGVDAFALAAGARNEAGARSFLTTVASTAGQIAFNRWKGSSPIRADVPRGQLDRMAQQTLADLEHAKIRMLMRSRPVWEEALASFARDHDRAALLRAFVDAPPDAV